MNKKNDFHIAFISFLAFTYLVFFSIPFFSIAIFILKSSLVFLYIVIYSLFLFKNIDLNIKIKIPIFILSSLFFVMVYLFGAYYSIILLALRNNQRASTFGGIFFIPLLAYIPSIALLTMKSKVVTTNNPSIFSLRVHKYILLILLILFTPYAFSFFYFRYYSLLGDRFYLLQTIVLLILQFVYISIIIISILFFEKRLWLKLILIFLVIAIYSCLVSTCVFYVINFLSESNKIYNSYGYDFSTLILYIPALFCVIRYVSLSEKNL